MNLDLLLTENKRWANQTTKNDPNFFKEMSKSQHPDILWIGCSDSRVPPNTILNLAPGKLFVLRNVANQASKSDPSYLSGLQYAIEGLNIQSIFVCGHSNCGGVKAVLSGNLTKSVKEWLEPLRQLALEHDGELRTLEISAREQRLCELNVKSQARNILDSSIVQSAIERGQKIEVHTLIYDVGRGLLRELKAESNGDTDSK